jgi:NAD+ diphosphatase
MPEPSCLETTHLAYNATCSGNQFQLVSPHVSPPEDPGYWVALRNSSVVFTTESGEPEIPSGEIPDWLNPLQKPLFIGFWRGQPIRVFAISGEYTLPLPYIEERFRSITPLVDNTIISVCGQAQQVCIWEKQSRFCSCCGGKMEWHSHGWGRRCCNCGIKRYPASSACAIVLVRRNHEVLMIHKSEWLDGRYSLPSGFMELGESLEECAIREVREETGIEIQNLHYIGSQNWPFPAQFMAGFIAKYAAGDIKIATNEIADARWFSIDDLPVLPSRQSIARWMIERYCRS